jgi:nondiscriminating glutamyl-tRNA synthetase
MSAGENPEDNQAVAVNPFCGADVAQVLLERGWMGADFALVGGEERACRSALQEWCERAAFLLGPQVADRVGLADLLGLVFEYDAARALGDVEAHNVMTRYAARDVIRILAGLVLDGGAGPCTPEKFSEMVTALKAELDIRGRELFHPVRLALAGRSGEGDLDRVILLIDAAAEAGFAVKTVRERMVQFCSVME